MFPHLSGLIAAPHTPFDSQGALHIEVVEKQAQLLLRDGVTGAFIAGSTGEGLSLSVEERLDLGRRWVDIASGEKLKIILHVGANSLPESCQMAQQAAEIGADAIAVVIPSYYRPASVEQLIAFCEPIARAASDLPFYLYDIPVMTGVHLPVAQFLAEGSKAIPNLTGLKYSNPDLMQLQECLALEDGRYNILYGSDETLIAALALGIRGAVGATYNFAAPLYQKIMSAFERGDLETAQNAQRRSVALVRALMRYGFLPASKYVMSVLGIDCGPVRPPLPTLTSEQCDSLRQTLEDLHVLTEPCAASVTVQDY